ncbi:hypothetical protein OC846_005224 [Tilletia horrida]|uniref:AB hydrolase-1 domain-containing protein n=1 Tax=Tilletia horrida TaxID=155126 RepID=A0AAN6GLV9_9BASI|nr:hypothetical protein OC845_005404 [Tilletia horrida]KAK0546530.1 hypothetical protein OC846_005224 [Tilletia horrida]KAK0562303.1 hypothetical protein OC861_005382 [Tilletia horrida]
MTATEAIQRDAAVTAAFLPVGAAYAGAPHDLLQQKGAFQLQGGRKPSQRRGPNNEELDPSVFNPATATHIGKHVVPVHPKCSHSKPFKMYYEVHGKGPVKLVFLMGLATSCAGWLAQVEHFSHATNGNTDKYSTLVYDQRGFGSSDVPKGRYRTSDMAYDLLSLLQALRWLDEPRQVHLVGVSMGGMVTLELAKMTPQHFASITLISTTSGQNLGSKSITTGMPPFKGVAAFTDVIVSSILRTKSPRQHLDAMIELLFPDAWLDEAHPDDPQHRSRRECLREMFIFRFRYSRHAPPDGVLRQITAVFTHGVSASELDRINMEIPSITIITGDQDHLVNPKNSDHLAAHLHRARFVKLKDSGHALPLQRAEEINEIIDQTAKLGLDRAQENYWKDRTARSVL